MTMLPRWSALLALALAACSALAFEVKLDETYENRQRCSGMYSRSTWGGPVDPVIMVKFVGPPEPLDNDPIASLVIFEWKDEELIGIPDPENPYQLIELCQEGFEERGWCTKEQVGQFLLAPNATRKSVNPIVTTAIHLNNAGFIEYPIKNTGYYCVFTDSFTAGNYEAAVEFRNAYGELPASQIPKLPFYGGITILYALVAVFWGFLYYQHRQDILPVQNYITAILVFLVVEMLMTWGFYQHLNQNGATIGSRALLLIVAILNAARNSFSFFLLLIVCMGYGVVKHTLGRTMVYVRWLAIAHFLFGIVYAVTSLLVSPESAGPLVLLIVLPLAGTLTAFYVWTLNSLNFTLKDLRERKQHAKEAMYKKLWWCILISIIVIFGFFFFNSLSFASVNDEDYVPFHWKTRWFILDGWLNIVYFADVAWVAYVWRPTANNRRFAMSDEIAQDDDGTFEIGDIGAPDTDDEDEEAQVGGRGNKTTGLHSRSSSESIATPSHSSGAQASQSHPPPPAPAPAQPQAGPSRSIAGQSKPPPPKPAAAAASRESLDGETIFAVGDDDKFSDSDSDDDDDDDDDNEEDAKLVRAPRK